MSADDRQAEFFVHLEIARSKLPRRSVIFGYLGIHLTQVIATGSVARRGSRGGLPALGGRLRKALRIGGSLPRLSFPGAMAGRIPLPSLRGGQSMATALRTPAVRELCVPSFVDSGDDIPGHAHSPEGLVPRPVVDDQPEERRQRSRPAARAGTRKLYLEFANHYREESYLSHKSPRSLPASSEFARSYPYGASFDSRRVKPISRGRGAVTFTT